MQFKVGDTIVPKDNAIKTFGEAIILARHPSKDGWLVEVVKPYEDVIYRSDSVLAEYYEKAPAFFEVDRVYEGRGGEDGKYVVVDIMANVGYAIGSPNLLQAQAMYTSTTGATYWCFLSMTDFRHMNEVKS